MILVDAKCTTNDADAVSSITADEFTLSWHPDGLDLDYSNIDLIRLAPMLTVTAKY